WSGIAALGPGRTLTVTITGTIAATCGAYAVSNTVWVAAGGACASSFQAQVLARVDTGPISTVAGSGPGGFGGDNGAATAAFLYYPEATAVDAAGNLYIADTDNSRIRKVDAATGVISTIAGNG